NSAKDDQEANDLKNHCQRHYSGRIQGELRTACAAPFEIYRKLCKSLAQTNCRVNYGQEPRLVMSCLIGVAIGDDIKGKKDGFLQKLQLCAEQYPQHTEIDAFLQESCLTGVHLSDLMTTDNQKGFESCAQLSPERSFIGPCAVGISFIADTQ